MNAIILCPGPRLFRWNDRLPKADLVIGVNRAPIWYDCDIWSALDHPLILKHRDEIKGSPTLVSIRDSFAKMSEAQYQWRGDRIVANDLFDYCPHPLNWILFSSTTALVTAAWKGAKRIDVYGADWDGTLDADGICAGSNRTETRWQQEATLWITAVVPWLNERGVEVIRHVVEGSVFI